MTKILISGGTGLIGRRLCDSLGKRGYQLALLSRNSNRHAEIPVYYWNPEMNEIEGGALDNADFIIHLAGANIGEKRWTKKRKQVILNSRVSSGKLLFDHVSQNNIRIKAFVTASAIGYYGTITSNKIFYESDPPAIDFLGQVCRQWEETADLFATRGIRTVKIRTALVLDSNGGALTRMITPARMGLGAALGKGTQYMPWIHIEDLCGIYIKALEDNKMSGAYNAVAPQDIINKDFIRALAQVLKKPILTLKIPAFTLKMLFGEMSAILLEGSRVSSEKIIESGYHFRFSHIGHALQNLLKEQH
jgi:uncharacterized protein